jgi:hypothetical protein
VVKLLEMKREGDKLVFPVCVCLVRLAESVCEPRGGEMGKNQKFHCSSRHFPSGEQGGAWATVGKAHTTDPRLEGAGRG